MVIVADDLSGSADCGIACVESGLEAVAIFGEAREAPAADVLCIDADTRRQPVGRAADETFRLIRRYAAPGALLYKKLDSTVRGHVGAEIAAALAAMRISDPGALAIVAPAYPRIGRTTRGGRQYLHDMPVEESEIWRTSWGDADLIQMMVRQGLSTALVAPGGDGLARAAAERDVLVCDAQTEEDLAAIARAGRALGAPVLWAGSGGLAHHLPAAFGLARQGKAPVVLAPLAQPLLFAVGSRSHVSSAQADALAAQAGVTTLLVPANDMDNPDWPARVMAALEVGDTLVRLGSEPADETRLSEAFAALLAPAVQRCGGLFLTGGETAHAVLKSVGALGLRLVGEMEPGVTLSLAQGGRFDNRPVVTKAGAFGAPGTMRHCRDALRAGLAF